MKIVLNERSDIQEIEVIINCISNDETVKKIVSSLSAIDIKLTCRKGNEVFQLEPADIYILSLWIGELFFIQNSRFLKQKGVCMSWRRTWKNALFFERQKQSSSIYNEYNRYVQSWGQDFCLQWITKKRSSYLDSMQKR